MWWGFFDWLAVVSWKALLLVSFLGLILGGILKLPTPGLLAHRRLLHHQGGGGRQAQSGTDRQRGHQAGRNRAARAHRAGSAHGSAAGADRAAFPLQYVGQHRPAHPDRSAARLQDAAEPDPLPALGHAADARRQPTHAGSAGRSLQRLPGNHGGAHGRTPAAGGECSGRLEIGGLPVDDVADAGGKRDQAWPGTEARGRPARDRRRDRRWPVGRPCARHRHRLHAESRRLAWDWPMSASG